MRPVPFHRLLAAALAVVLAACDAPAEPGAASPDATTTADASSGLPIQPKPAQAMQEFQAALGPVIDQAKSMTQKEFLAAHTPADAPKPLTLGYDPTKAKYFDLVDGALELTAAEKAKLAQNGFVVSERLTYPTMGEALVAVYHKDLPVLVTTDLILQALHASYDDVLQSLEKYALLGLLGDVLQQAHAGLAKVDPGPDAQAQLAWQDADFFVTLARSLLAGQPAQSLTGKAVDAQVTAFLAHVAGLQLQDVSIFGVARKMDFSQFKPRGHYEGDAELERYFRAMMWLGRADLRFLEPDAQSGTWLYRPRQLMTAVLLGQAMAQGTALAQWHKADDLIGVMVGPVDYIDFKGLAKLVADEGFLSASDVAALTDAQVQDLSQRLVAGQYGSQRIASHWLETDPLSSEATPLPPSFAFLGQRFVVDSHVFANVVYDRVLVDGQKIPRVLPDPLDALFVLGNDLVLPLLQPELDQFPYHGSLHTLRWLVDSYDTAFWQSNVYNLWLSALRELNAPTTAAKFPQPMRTPAWRDKTVRTQLASWAQLRHDTLLYAKQSYTGGVSCEHPDGWVEPYPAFYGKLATLADVAGQALLNAPLEGQGKWLQTKIQQFFGNWKAHMAKLQALAEKELAGQPFTAEDVAFLQGIIVSDPGCGAPVYSGWYPSLYFNPDNIDQFKPTIADVHTNPNSGPLPGPNVLHVATAGVDLLVLAADTCEGAETFVGPVFRYHQVDVQEIKRLSDSEWTQMLQAGQAPPQPAWTQSFVVPAP